MKLFRLGWVEWEDPLFARSHELTRCFVALGGRVVCPCLQPAGSLSARNRLRGARNSPPCPFPACLVSARVEEAEGEGVEAEETEM